MIDNINISTYIIYQAVNKINDKVYIGKTIKKLNYRMKRHLYENKNTYFHKALRKYGINNFIWKIVDYVNSKEELNKKEKYWINFYNSRNKNIGYNITKGGDGGDTFTNNPKKEKIRQKFKNRKMSEEHKKAISKASIGNKYSKGYKHTIEQIKKRIDKVKGQKRKPISEEHKKAISKKLKGRIFTEEHKLKISKALKGRQSAMKNKKHTIESRIKMSKKLKGQKRNPLTKEHKRKLSESHKREKNHFYGKHHTEETKEKIRRSKMKKC